MKKLSIIIALILSAQASPLCAFDINPIIRGFIDGQAARQQSDYMGQQLELQRLEAERMRQETELLRQENEHRRQKEEAENKQQHEQQLFEIIMEHIAKIKDAEYRVKAYDITTGIMKEANVKTRIISYEELLKILKDRLQKQETLEYFLTQIKPHVLKVHPDLDDILLDPQTDYWQWAEKQESKLKDAALNSSNPEDIIWAISEYKKYRKNRI